MGDGVFVEFPNGESANADEVVALIREIPDFDLGTRPSDLVEKVKQGVVERSLDGGRYPKLHRYFRENDILYSLMNNGGYGDWSPKQIINGKDIKTSRNFNLDEAAPFYLNTESKEKIEMWQQEGRLEEIWKKLNKTRVEPHIMRLLSHQNASACTDFAVALMDYVAKKDIEDIENIFPGSGDGNEAAIFYTFAPYIYEDLRVNGMSDTEAFDKVVMWLCARISDQESSSYPGNNAKYPGMNKFVADRVNEEFLLDCDGRSESHNLARKTGEHIASILKGIPYSEEIVREKNHEGY